MYGVLELWRVKNITQDEEVIRIETNIDKQIRNKILIFIMIGLFFGLGCAASFYIGAAITCDNSDGTLMLPVKCMNIKNVTACYDNRTNTYNIPMPAK